MVSRGQMEVTRLDDFLTCDEPLPYRYGVVKMDVEGFEAYVVEGGARVLREARIPFLTMEWKEPTAVKSPEHLQYILDFFYDLGYRSSTSGFFDNLGQLSVNELNSNTIFFTLDQETVSKD